MDRGKNQCMARAVSPIAVSSRAFALHLLRLLLPRLLLDHTQEAFLKHALGTLVLKKIRRRYSLWNPKVQSYTMNDLENLLALVIDELIFDSWNKAAMRRLPSSADLSTWLIVARIASSSVRATNQ